MDQKEIKISFDGIFTKVAVVGFVAALTLMALNPWLKPESANAAGNCKFSPAIIRVTDQGRFLDTCTLEMFFYNDKRIETAGRASIMQ